MTAIMLKRFRSAVQRTHRFVGSEDTMPAAAHSRFALRSAAVVVLALGMLVGGASAEVIFSDGEDVLTIEMLRHSLDLVRFDPLYNRDDAGIEILLAKAGSALIPYYYEIMTTPEDPLAERAAGRLLYMAPREYRTELRQILLKPEYMDNPPTGIIGLLDEIGAAEDAPLLYPHLLNKEFPRVRLAAAEVLEKIGDAETLEAIEAMRPDIERVQRELMEELPSLREKWLARGRTPEVADGIVESDRIDRERVYREMERAIAGLRERVAASEWDRSPTVQDRTPHGVAVSEDAEADAPARQAAPLDAVPAATDGAGNGPEHFAVFGLGLVLVGLLCAWLLPRRHRSRSDSA